MSYEDHAEDVAADFRDALEGLTMNSRVEITTLTVIARENTEYAHAISEVLQEHIKKVAPARKLPALYLLDSIVKNVGTPYTIYFSRGLYTTFMDAYASVDNMTRRKMDEMLKTWKEGVPGSGSNQSVFPRDTWLPIETALNKVRTSTFQAQQEHMRNEQQLLGRARPHGAMPYRETPTPPAGRPGYPQQQQQQQQQQQPPYSSGNGPPFGAQSGPPQAQSIYPIHPAQPSTQSTPQPPSVAPVASPFPPPQPAQAHFVPPGSVAGISIESVNDDIERLIHATKAEFAEKSYDASVAARLKALLDLQMILKSQNLEYDKLMLVKNQIDALSVNLPAHLKAQFGATATPPTGFGPYQPPPASTGGPAGPGPGAAQQGLPPALAAAAAAALAAARNQAQAPAPAPAPAAAASTVSVDSLFGKGALAALLAARQHQQPPAAAAPPAPPAAPPAAPPTMFAQAAPAGANTSNPLALVDMLRKAGLLQNGPSGTSAPRGASVVAPTPVSLAPGLANVIQASWSPALGPRDPLREIQNDIFFQPESLKKFRPHMLSLMYDDLGPPCTQCGRRFRTDEAGRATKTAHMDWHFRVHQRIVEAEKRGQHRSWYVDAADWIHSREAPDADRADQGADGSAGAGGAGGAASHLGGASGGGSGGAANGVSKVQWIPVPSGGAGTNQVCPICQEKFEMKWLDEAQEWVWIDAVQVGQRVYHASCHAEATKGGANRDHPAAAAMAAMLSGAISGVGAGRGHYARNTPEPVLGKRKATEDSYAPGGNNQHGGRRDNGGPPTQPAAFHGGGNGNNNNSNNSGGSGGGGGKNGRSGRKKKRSGAGGGGRRPPDLDRVDPDIGGGGPGGVAGGHRRNGKRGGGGGGGGGGAGHLYWSDGGGSSAGSMHGDAGREEAKVDLNALPY